MDELVPIQIKKVLGPIETSGAAILLGNDDKTFVMFVGPYEGTALMRELNGETAIRPMTHDLLAYVLTGFDIEIKSIVITDLIKNTYCATLILEQRVRGESGEWEGRRNEVRIDARPSDCLILAAKEGKEIFCTRAVLDKVRDIHDEIEGLKASGGFLSAEEKSLDLPDLELDDMSLGDEDDPDDD